MPQALGWAMDHDVVIGCGWRSRLRRRGCCGTVRPVSTCCCARWPGRAEADSEGRGGAAQFWRGEDGRGTGDLTRRWTTSTAVCDAVGDWWGCPG